MFDPDAINGPRYFGHTKFAEGDMVGAVQDLLSDKVGEEAQESAERIQLIIEA